MSSTKPPPAKSRSRKWLRRTGVACAAVVLFIVAMPVWLPWVLVPVLKNQGVSIESCDRLGASRLQLNGVKFTNDFASLEVDQLKFQLPHQWLMDRYGARGTRDKRQIEIDGWDLLITTSTNASAPSTNSLHIVLDQSTELLKSIRPWLQNIDIADGDVSFGELSIDLPNISISNHELDLDLAYTNLPATAQVSVDFSNTNGFELNTIIPEFALTNVVSLNREQSIWTMVGETDWQGNIAMFSGSLSANGWLPSQIAVSGTNWTIAASTIGLDGYDALTGSFNIGWTNAHYVFRVNGQALPSFDNALLPDQIDVNVAGQGTLESLAIETLNIATPALFAELSNPLAVDFTGRMLVPETTLTVSADFIPEDLLPFTGKLEGTVTARPDANEVVNADFQAALNQFEGFGLNLDQLNLEGALNWPSLVVSNCSFTFPNAGAFTMDGKLNLVSQEATEFDWAFAGAIPTNLIPASLELNDVDASGSFNGVWPSFDHESNIQIGELNFGELRLDSLQIEATGKTSSTNTYSLTAKHGTAGIDVAGNIDLSRINDRAISGQLLSFEAAANDRISLNLADPAVFTASMPPPNTNTITSSFSARIDPLVFVGDEKQLALSADVDWPSRGQFLMTATNLSTSDLPDSKAFNIPNIQLEEISLNASWDDGPLRFENKLRGKLPLDDADHVEWKVEASGDERGITFSPSQLGFNGQPVVEVAGRVPATLRLDQGKPVLDWAESEEFRAKMSLLPAELFWRELEDRFQVRVTNPQLNLSARGSLEDFQSDLDLSVSSIQPLMITNAPIDLVTVTNFVMHVTASHDEVHVSEGSFVIAGNQSSFRGKLPLDASTWDEWFEKLKTPDWDTVSGSFQIPKLDIAKLGEFAGTMLRPMGRATVDVRLEPGRILNGTISLTNIATRSIEPIGSIRDIQGTVKFTDQSAQLDDVQAMISGEAVRLGGGISWTMDGLSDVDVSLMATNITLVRTVDLFLRGDLNLHVRSDGTQSPTVGGEVSLHNSLLFQDIGNLMEVNLDQPTKRPPFFSFSQQPFADWGLDVRVKGQKFLRVLSPVFKGNVSTGLQLAGTLKEPVAMGEVSIESGQILFPFGSLDVRRGSVQLTREEPHRPRVDFRGQGMNFGYNVSIDVTGQADAPNIIFNSVPPLTTREIMLMMTAGEIPSGDYSFTDIDKASKLGYFLGKELINQLLGMDSGEDKLLFRTGEYVTDDGQLTYRIEYKLLNWLAVFGEYTRFRDYNGGLKFNIYSR